MNLWKNEVFKTKKNVCTDNIFFAFKYIQGNRVNSGTHPGSSSYVNDEVVFLSYEMSSRLKNV